MSATDDYLAAAARYAADFTAGDLPLPPARHTAVVACMDARLNPYGLLGLTEGDSHVIRNAGGVVTEDVLVHHTDCGMLTFTDDGFAEQLERDTGSRPAWRAHAFADLEEDVRAGLRTVRQSPFVLHTDQVRGFVDDVTTGALSEVDTRD